MRSFILKATIAAALAAIPLSAGYAASSQSSQSASSAGSHATSAGAESREALGAAERADRERGQAGLNGQSDPAPYMTEPMTAQPGYHAFSLAAPLAYRGNRLATIESELGQTLHQVNVDRRRGELTPRESQFVRREDGAVRTEAVDIAKRNDGQIPTASYAMLQDRVSDLNRTIYNYETGVKRG